MIFQSSSSSGLSFPSFIAMFHFQLRYINVHLTFNTLFTVKVLSRVFRGKFLAGLKRLHRRNQLCCAGPAAALADPQQFAKLLRRLHRHDWVVYAKPAFGAPMSKGQLSLIASYNRPSA